MNTADLLKDILNVIYGCSSISAGILGIYSTTPLETRLVISRDKLPNKVEPVCPSIHI